MSEYNERPVFHHGGQNAGQPVNEPEFQWLEDSANYLITLTCFVIVQTFVLAFHFGAALFKAFFPQKHE